MHPFLPFYYLCQINPKKIMKMLRYYHHPDHLGSSASTELSNHWITDGSGNAIQHLHYLPLKSFAFFPPWRSVKEINFLYAHCLRRFGEDWVDQRNSSWNAPYTFSGKEKDMETGYGYFGARYYNSGLSIWLYIDPMSYKYPSMSPYVYCANNPVILVDPDGRDIYTFDEKGYLLDVEENKEVDRIVIINKNKNTRRESKDFASGTIKGNVADFKSMSGLPDATMFATDNSQAAEEVFLFLADNSEVEWGLINTESNNCTSFIGTNHERSQNDIPDICVGMLDKIVRFVHNHPSDNNATSEGDHYGSVTLEKLDPNVQQYNYTKSNGYTRYNSNTDFSTKFHGELDSFQISVPSYKTN
ncbi:MAG: type secretion protein Rhs [Bacteroidetes bacterium]|nr:type secretion protein Rhs [Bacteroidota bacterium]